ncbi:hypothetical protein HK101_008848 [Irineochytrium annulatum]|nr:hypothetical protein HK101_008848 [Irineochytrium annulatum]
MTITTIGNSFTLTGSLAGSADPAKGNSLVAGVDVPYAAVTAGTTAYFQFSLYDLLANVTRQIICDWSSKNTLVTCPNVADEGDTCYAQSCTFDVPAASSFPPSTYQIDIKTCLSSVSADDCKAAEGELAFRTPSTYNFTISKAGVWTGTWGSTAPGPSAVTPSGMSSVASMAGGSTGSVTTSLPPITPTTIDPNANASSTSSSSSSPSSTVIIAIAAIAGIIVVTAIGAAIFFHRARAAKRGATPAASPARFNQQSFGPAQQQQPASVAPVQQTSYYEPPLQSTTQQYAQQPQPQQQYGQQQQYGVQRESYLPTMQQPNFAFAATQQTTSEFSYPGGSQYGQQQQQGQSSMMSSSAGAGAATASEGTAPKSEKSGLWNPEATQPQGAGLPAYHQTGFQ